MTDGPSVDELVPVTGTWGGTLFENPRIDLPLSLTWSFEFECEPVTRSYGSTPCSLTVEWVPNLVESWLDHGGSDYRCQQFAAPIESSCYFFSHHRFDVTELALVDQSGSRLVADIKLEGDIDGLGLPSIHLLSTLDFSGIIVVAEAEHADVERDAQTLSRFTDVSSLVGTVRGTGSVFTPGATV